MKNRPSLELFQDADLARQHDETCDLIEGHIRSHLGPVEDIFYSDHKLNPCAVDIMVVEPTASRDYYTLVTAGFSNFKFSTHAKSKIPMSEHIELYINLPKHWRFDDEALKDFEMLWPLSILRYAAEVSRLSCGIYHGATFMLSPPDGFFIPGTSFYGLSLLSSMQEFKEFETLQVSPDKRIDFYNIFPVYFQEAAWCDINGATPFEMLLLSNGYGGVIDLNRKNVITNT